MLLNLPRPFHSEDDDYAPVDYTFVGSIAEGARRQQSVPIHRGPEQTGVRHRADPTTREGAEATTQTQTVGEPRGYEAARRLPRVGDGPAPAASVAYPRPRDNAFAQKQTFAPQTPPQLPVTRPQGSSTALGMPAQRSEGYRGNRYADEPAGNAQAQRQAYAAQTAAYPPQTDTAGKPAREALPGNAGVDEPSPTGDAAEIPEWLRLARQNNFPLFEERRQRAPRVETAPATPPEPSPTDLLGRPMARTAPPKPVRPTPTNAEEYEAAGYPPELIAQMRSEEEAVTAALGYGQKRHGAQVAVPPQRPAAPVQAEPYGRPAQANPTPRQARTPYSQPQDQPEDTFAARSPYPAREGSDPRGAYARYDAPDSREQYAGYDAPDPRVPYAAREPYDARRSFAPRGNNAAWDAPAEGNAVDYTPRNGYDPQAAGYTPNPYGRTGVNGYQRYPAPGDPPPEDWQDEAPEEEKPRLKVPLLGIATFAAAMLLVLLWIMQTTFNTQRVEVLANRAALSAKIADNYPLEYRELIEQQAAANNLHPAFVAAIVLNESSFNPKAESDVGARGLMQMMPDTAEWVHGKMGDTATYSFDLMYDADTNVRYACWYLAYLSDLFHNDPVLVSAAFHAGQTTVQNWLNDSRYSADSQSIDLASMAEGPTKNYATRVVRAFAAYRRLYYEGGLTQTAAAQAAGTHVAVATATGTQGSAATVANAALSPAL